MDNQPNFVREANLEWAGSRDRNLAFRSRQNFFLDIPFYRTHRPFGHRVGPGVPWSRDSPMLGSDDPFVHPPVNSYSS